MKIPRPHPRRRDTDPMVQSRAETPSPGFRLEAEDPVSVLGGLTDLATSPGVDPSMAEAIAGTAPPSSLIDPLDEPARHYLERVRARGVKPTFRDQGGAYALSVLERERGGSPVSARVVVDLADGHNKSAQHRFEFIRPGLLIDLRTLIGFYEARENNVRKTALAEVAVLHDREHGSRAGAPPPPSVVCLGDATFLSEELHHLICDHHIKLAMTAFTAIYRGVMRAIPDHAAAFNQERSHVQTVRNTVLDVLIEALSEVPDRRRWAVDRLRNYMPVRGRVVDEDTRYHEGRAVKAIERRHEKENDLDLRWKIEEVLELAGVHFRPTHLIPGPDEVAPVGVSNRVGVSKRALAGASSEPSSAAIQARAAGKPATSSSSFEDFSKACNNATNHESWRLVRPVPA